MDVEEWEMRQVNLYTTLIPFRFGGFALGKKKKKNRGGGAGKLI